MGPGERSSGPFFVAIRGTSVLLARCNQGSINEESFVRIPKNAQIVIANGERFLLMRNAGQPFDPKLEKVGEFDLLLTNFSAGVRHQDPAGQRNGSSDIDELAHGAAIAEWLNERALKGELGETIVAADPRTLGQIRQHYHKETESRILGEIDKDLTNLPIPDIEKSLSGV